MFFSPLQRTLRPEEKETRHFTPVVSRRDATRNWKPVDFVCFVVLYRFATDAKSWALCKPKADPSGNM
jgi:hypothetical protein